MTIKKATAKKVKKKILRCIKCKIEGTTSNKLIRYEISVPYHLREYNLTPKKVLICRECYVRPYVESLINE